MCACILMARNTHNRRLSHSPFDTLAIKFADAGASKIEILVNIICCGYDKLSINIVLVTNLSI